MVLGPQKAPPHPHLGLTHGVDVNLSGQHVSLGWGLWIGIRRELEGAGRSGIYSPVYTSRRIFSETKFRTKVLVALSGRLLTMQTGSGVQ